MDRVKSTSGRDISIYFAGRLGRVMSSVHLPAWRADKAACEIIVIPRLADIADQAILLRGA